MRDGVLAEQDRAQPPADEGGDHLGQRSGDAGDAVGGFDAKEILFEAEGVRRGLRAAFEVVADTVLGIDVDRPHQPFLPERPLGLHCAAQAQQADRGDLHDGSPFWIIMSFAGGVARVRVLTVPSARGMISGAYRWTERCDRSRANKVAWRLTKTDDATQAQPAP